MTQVESPGSGQNLVLVLRRGKSGFQLLECECSLGALLESVSLRRDKMQVYENHKISEGAGNRRLLIS
jgi:hypothetical protein